MVVIKIEYLKLGRCSKLLKIGRYIVQDTVLITFIYSPSHKTTKEEIIIEKMTVKKYIWKRAKIRWNKYLVISIFPEAGHFEEGNSLNLAVTAVVRQKSRVTVHNYPLTSYILQRCPLREFGGKQFHLILDVMCPRSNQWKRALFRATRRQFSENICSEDDLRSRILGTFFVKFLPCLPLLGFSNV